MKGRSGNNRAICIGDRERSGVGSIAVSNEEILKRISRWSTPFLKKFIIKSSSKPWKEAAVWLLAQREGLDRQIKKIQNKRHSRSKKTNVASKECRP